jgi:hypothetical protein
VRRAKTIAALATSAATVAIVIAGPSTASGAGGIVSVGGGWSPDASAAVETQVRYLPSGRKPVRLRIAYRGVCTVDCKVFARTTLVLPGPNIGPVNVSNSFAANQIFEAFIRLNRAGLAALNQNRRAARLRTRIRAIDLSTNEVDIDRRTFRFKHG